MLTQHLSSYDNLAFNSLVDLGNGPHGGGHKDNMPDDILDHVTALESVIVRHGFQDSVGISFLHRHDSAGPGEMLLESFEPDSGRLISRIVPGEMLEGASPSNLAWCQPLNAFVPVEYSDDPLVPHHLASLRDTERGNKFLMEASELLVSSHVATVLGVCIHARARVAIPEGYFMLEDTDAEGRSTYTPCAVGDDPRSLPLGEGVQVVATMWAADVARKGLKELRVCRYSA